MSPDISLFIVGTHFGDEGKGKIVDVMASQYRYAVRFSGGNNAGHTLYHNGNKIVLHLIPSAVLHPTVTCVIGPGVVIDPVAFQEELNTINQVITLDAKALAVSGNAAIIFSCHSALDQKRESALGTGKIGTTGKGIGPAYEDIAARRAIRGYDLFAPSIQHKIELLASHYATPLDTDHKTLTSKLMQEASAAKEILSPYLTDTTALLHQAIKKKEPILFEGAQGAMLDVHAGSWPYVTSSATMTGGLLCGTRLPATALDKILGVSKAYTTRVGNGTLPTQIPEPLQSKMVDLGKEFGATTGRTRRCGWLDLPLLRHAIRQCGINQLCISKLDVLDSFDQLNLCYAYQLDGAELLYPPDNPNQFANCKPLYHTIEGWNTPTSALRTPDQLPPQLKAYLSYIEQQTETPVSMVSVGAQREDMVWLDS